MNSLGDCAQPVWPVINSVHRGDDSGKNRRRANVARCLVATDMLLAGLQRESIGAPTFRVVRNAHQPAGHVTFVSVAGGEVCRVRPAKPKRSAETLRATDREIRAKFPGWFQ